VDRLGRSAPRRHLFGLRDGPLDGARAKPRFSGNRSKLINGQALRVVRSFDFGCAIEDPVGF
jgi:hypothetical protein